MIVFQPHCQGLNEYVIVNHPLNEGGGKFLHVQYKKISNDYFNLCNYLSALLAFNLTFAQSGISLEAIQTLIYPKGSDQHSYKSFLIVRRRCENLTSSLKKSISFVNPREGEWNPLVMYVHKSYCNDV
jgi:hypothetical protein